MSEFSELIKNFEKIRTYAREFFVYGFKSRNDFEQKSSRSYDNERRRIESYLGEYLKYNYNNKEKNIYISVNSAKIKTNPLYKVWKSKSFTDNDIMLHFYIIDVLKKENDLTIEEITNNISEKTNKIFEIQTVRNKCKEYIKEEILTVKKDGKKFLYSLAKEEEYLYTQNMKDALSYFQNESPFGIIGSTILDKLNFEENIFSFKHLYIMHTLDENVLYKIISAMKDKKSCKFINKSTKLKREEKIHGVPLKILTSTQTGRKYVLVYKENSEKFISLKLNNIKDVKELEESQIYDDIKLDMEKNMNRCWGVSFPKSDKNNYIKLKLKINEKYENYIIKRLEIEGRGGKIEKLDENTFEYYKEVFDVNEMIPWIKTFTGRIISLESNNEYIVNKYNKDMERMFEMYDLQN